MTTRQERLALRRAIRDAQDAREAGSPDDIPASPEARPDLLQPLGPEPVTIFPLDAVIEAVELCARRAEARLKHAQALNSTRPIPSHLTMQFFAEELAKHLKERHS